MSLLKGLSILFIFLKNQLLDLLILRIVLLVSMPFNSALILVISFLLPALGCLYCPQVLVGIGLGGLFEMFLSFLGRQEKKWTMHVGQERSVLPSLCVCTHFKGA